MFKCLSVLFLMIVVRSSAENDNIACCPPGLFVSYKMRKCWMPTNNDTSSLRLTCKNVLRQSKFIINSEGNVEIGFSNRQPAIYKPDVACVGNETNKKNQTAIRSITLLCYDEDEPGFVSEHVFGYCMIVSVLFLTLTAGIYGALKELRDLHGKSVINLCGSLAIGFAILSIMKLMAYTDMALCATRGFLAYFFIIAAFFWTNAISIQVLRSTRQPSMVTHGWKEFTWYALYAWGCPTVLTVVMAIINFHPGKHDKPGIGLNHCWFLDNQQWYYMYSVMSILIIINIFIFIYTSSIVWRHSFSSGHIRALRYRLTMTIRLIIVMGLLWIFEMVGSLSKKHVVWACLDVLNTLQGPLIFLVLVVLRKRAVKAMLRHGWLDCISGTVEKFLAAGSDAEDHVIQHTDVPMNDH